MNTNVQTVALAKLIKDKALKSARAALKIGTHPVDCLVHISGTLKVGADSQAEVRAGSVPYKQAFATVCGMLKQQCADHGHPLRPELLTELIAMAMAQDYAAAQFGETMTETVEAVERTFTRPTGKTTTKKGAVTTKLEYEFKPIAPVGEFTDIPLDTMPSAQDGKSLAEVA